MSTPPKPAALRGRRQTLSRETIAAAAIAIADEDGLEAVSMRRVAQRLDVGTMSLYHHVRDKSALWTAMADAIMGAQVIPADEMPEGWREGLAEIARRARRIFTDHPWVLASWHSGDRGEPGHSFLQHIEQTMAIVEEWHWMPLEERMGYAGVIDAYATGFTMHNLVDPDERWFAQVREMASPEEYPRLVAAFGEFDGPPADEFELGLQVILDGIEAAVARSRP